MCVAKAAELLGRRVVFIASSDLSHKLKVTGPYGYSKQENNMIRWSPKPWQGKFASHGFSEEFLEKAAECGHRTFVIMVGALDKNNRT